MPYIAPNSDVIILKNVPLTPAYTNTIYFDSHDDQESYFRQHRKFTLSEYQYVRVTDGKINVKIMNDQLYDVNYMMFRNTTFSERWFYAFVTNARYVNNEVTELTFEIDVMQTWWFDWDAVPCWIDREHSATDEIGDNVLPENLDTGEYYLINMHEHPFRDKQTDYAALCTFDKQYNDAAMGHYFNVFSGLVPCRYNFDFDLKNFIRGAVTRNKQDGIVEVYQLPKEDCFEHDILLQKPYHDIGGYYPVNNKLFTAPFIGFFVSDQQGNVGKFAFEDFYDNEQHREGFCQFLFDYTVLPPVEVSCVPQYYKGIIDNQNERMIAKFMPVCTWNADSYKAWIAQNQVKFPVMEHRIKRDAVAGGLSALGSLLSLDVGGAISKGISAATTAHDKIEDTMVEAKEHDLLAPQAKGQVNSYYDWMNNDAKPGFHFYEYHPKYEFCQRIDDYFTLYGYKSGCMGLPWVFTDPRPYWNYVKTIGAEFTGNVPANDLLKINSIFDNGVRFWMFHKNDSFTSGVDVGNYDQNNAPVFRPQTRSIGRSEKHVKGPTRILPNERRRRIVQSYKAQESGNQNHNS